MENGRLLDRKLAVVLVEVDLDSSRLARNATQFGNLLDLTLGCLVAPSHVDLLLLSLVLGKDPEDVFHGCLSLLLRVLFTSK